jgi:hypothetical protein
LSLNGFVARFHANWAIEDIFKLCLNIEQESLPFATGMVFLIFVKVCSKLGAVQDTGKTETVADC